MTSEPASRPHDLDGVLVAQVVGAFNGVVGVVMPVVARVFERGVYAALGGVGVASDGVDFGYDGHIRAVLTRGESGPHSGQSRAYDEYVMGVHSTYLLDLRIPSLKIAYRAMRV